MNIYMYGGIGLVLGVAIEVFLIVYESRTDTVDDIGFPVLIGALAGVIWPLSICFIIVGLLAIGIIRLGKWLTNNI